MKFIKKNEWNINLNCFKFLNAKKVLKGIKTFLKYFSNKENWTNIYHIKNIRFLIQLRI